MDKIHMWQEYKDVCDTMAEHKANGFVGLYNSLIERRNELKKKLDL